MSGYKKLLLRASLFVFVFIGCTCKADHFSKAYFLEILKKEPPPFAPIPGVCSGLSKQINEEMIFFINYGLPSNRERFFVLDLEHCLILERGLACSGRVNEEGRVRFSNVPGSNCSSKGLMKIGEKYTGQFGKSFRLHGMESGNSNVLNRFVVLHSHECVPDEVVEYNICNSQGCPTVSPNYWKVLEKYVDSGQVKHLFIK